MMKAITPNIPEKLSSICKIMIGMDGDKRLSAVSQTAAIILSPIKPPTKTITIAHKIPIIVPLFMGGL
jgi:hypothetical protein